MKKDELERMLTEARTLRLPSIPNLEELISECQVCPVCGDEAVIITGKDMCMGCFIEE